MINLLKLNIKIKIFIYSILIIGITSTIQLVLPAGANALSGDQFRSGRIADDSIFFNGRSMTTTDIQNFLNAKVPACDTNGTKSYGGTTRAAYAASKGVSTPFICLKNYTENTPSKPYEAGLCSAISSSANNSAAQIIDKVARACGVSQKTLLVLLQKEQSLITDDWPWPIQYRSATGYGCPDTAPCDTEYYGFFNQVYQGARAFKRYAKNPEYYGYRANRTNYVRYNPNAACGGKNIFLENQATAGLYVYTPYQPNTAALSNLYGSGDSCSAYGNRNFWRIFNDWFGRTTSLGKKMSGNSEYSKAPCSPPVIQNNQVARLYHPDVNNYLYTQNPQEVCPAIKIGYIYDGITMSSVSSSDPNSSPVFRLSGYGRHIFTSSETVKTNYINQGYKYEGIGFYAYTEETENSSPVYCLVKGDIVIYTSSGGEKVGLQQQGFNNVGVAFLVPDFNKNDIASRYSDSRNRRLYTSNSVEKTRMNSFGFEYEGVSSEFKINRAPNIDNSPLYRLRTPNGLYFFTGSRIERDLAVINYGYYSEGIAFYTPGNSQLGDKAVYRIVDPKTQKRIFTPSIIERDIAITKYGYKSEGVGFYALDLN